jgi:dephospho-CoA kinase
MFLIGLTGNIASGKSTVRRMLEQLGARTIDADALAHAVLRKGTPAWRAVVEAFGQEVLHPDGQVDRQKLGDRVFGDPAKLQQLEAITHPAISTQLALLLLEAREPVVVVEAVKLIEAGLHLFCDAVWIVTAPLPEAKRRLMQERSLSEAEAEARLRAQPPLEEKLKVAAAMIDNGGSIEATRVHVMRAFASIRPQSGSDKTPMLAALLGLEPRAPGSVAHQPSPPPPAAVRGAEGADISVRRARPGDAAALASILAQAEGASEPLSRAEILKRFGKYGYWLAEAEGQLLALAAWRAENLVAIIHDLWAQSPELAPRAFPPLFAAIEQEAYALQCEVALVLTKATSEAAVGATLASAGYTAGALEQIHQLWRGVAQGELREGEGLYFKRLREEMVTKPI